MKRKKLLFLDKLLNFVNQYDFQEDEVFRELKNYNFDCRYFVSNYGNVITLYYNNWKLLKPQLDKDGYLYLKLSYKGKRKRKAIHQLVAECFLVNPAPTEKTQIHHLDYNPLNNYYLNLQYVSPKEHRAIHKKHNKELAEKQLNNNANRKNS